jgi:hypothetical protein
VLADFSFFVKKLGAQLGQLLTAAVLELSGENVVGKIAFHGWCTSTFKVAEFGMHCL